LLSANAVFVTGNASKLKEVREILAEGTPLELESRAIDRKQATNIYISF